MTHWVTLIRIDIVRRGGDNSIMRNLTRSLALLSCLLLPLPQGWCCSFGPAGCCEAKARAKQAPKPPEGGRCCCPEQTIPEADEGTSAPAPATPSCCCSEKEPAAAPDTTRPLPDLDASLVLFLNVISTDTFATAAPVVKVFVISPPRHVLHCVWLC